MDATGGVPEPLLPPQIALQNPDLVGGELFHVLPRLAQILVMLDSDGDENYVPHLVPIAGGFPVPLDDAVFVAGRSHLLEIDDDAEIAFFAVESREESVMTAVRVHLPTRAAESLWQSPYGAFVAAWTPDHSRGRVRRRLHHGRRRSLRGRRTAARTIMFGTPIDERDPESTLPAQRLPQAHGTLGGAGLLLDDHALRRQGLPRVPRPLAARRARARRDRRSSPRGSRGARGPRAPRRRSLRARPTTSTAARGRMQGRSTRQRGRSRRPRARRRRRPRGRRAARASLRSPAVAASSPRSARRRARRSSTCCPRGRDRRRR